MRVINFKIFYIFIIMDNIIEPNNNFDFTKITLGHPSGLQGGSYFTKIEFNKKPLYIQTTKSLTRQAIIKSGKKYYCDLMFDKNSEILINWFENLENTCKKLIYNKKDDWFQGNLEENDIENAFNPLIRIYKSGKYYLLRTNIKNNKDDNPVIKIYNENEIMLTINDVTPETEIISILEIQGIKFTTKNFQIEIDLKQIMILENDIIFDNCLIKKTNKKNKELKTDKLKEDELKENEYKLKENEFKEDELKENIFKEDELKENEFKEYEFKENEFKEDELKEDEFKENKLKEDNLVDVLENQNLLETLDKNEIFENNLNKNDDKLTLDIEFEDLTEDNIEDNIELKDISNINFNLDQNETIKLKKPNQVYFELYKEARNKAKQAKKNAILAYLEAKNIKKTYMIENINDSDCEFDAEIDEVSESELEGL